MIVFKPTGLTFTNWKEAKLVLGTNRARRLNRKGLLEFKDNLE